MTCQEFVRALSAQDRRMSSALVEHSYHCERCRWLWNADQELATRAEARPSMSMAPELSRALATHRGPTRSSSPVQRLSIVSVPLALLLAAAGVGFGRPDLGRGLGGPFWSGALLLAASLAALIHVHLYRDVSGHPAGAWVRRLSSLAALGSFEIFAWLDAVHGVPLVSAHPSHDCLGLGCAVALAIGAAAVYALHRSVLSAPSASGALAGAIGGLSAVLSLHLHCAAAAGLHLQVIHGLPLLAAIALGSWVCRGSKRSPLMA